ncbi:MAG TPA: two-component regulator propeller domain-containing protein, partial [Pyrinomonadaceae bacterium]
MQSNCSHPTTRKCRTLLGPLLLGALLVCLTPPAHGQGATTAAAASTDAPRLPGFHAETWTTEQGLPGDTVRAVRQTRDGYLWIATQAG